jgi:hypothetical protein
VASARRGPNPDPDPDLNSFDLSHVLNAPVLELKGFWKSAVANTTPILYRITTLLRDGIHTFQCL